MKKKPARKKKPVKTVKKKSSSLSLQAGANVWPIERDVLFRPDRFKYVRKLIKPNGCVFCASASSPPNFETLCIHQTKHSMLVLNKFPYNSGHLLVLPRRHVGDLLEMSKEEYVDMMELLRTSIKVLNQLYQPGGMNVGLNHGAVAGAGIPEHLHFHIVPRWAGDLNFFPLIADTKVVIESLEQTWDRLASAFKNLQGDAP